MNLPPGLYGRRLVVQAGVIWFLVRLGVGTLALTAGGPEPLALAPGASVLLVSLVSAITWIDLHRRNLVVLLPNLGTPVAMALAIAASVAAAAEAVVAFIVP